VNVVRTLPSHGPHCVACGDGNPGSLGLTFTTDGERVHAAMRLDERHQGAPGFAHGGILATALDDTFGTLLVVLQRPAVTAKLEMQYRRPAFIHTDYTVVAWVERVDGRKLHFRGELRDAAGEIVAEGRALFLEVDVKHFAQNGADMPQHIKDYWAKGKQELPY